MHILDATEGKIVRSIPLQAPYHDRNLSCIVVSSPSMHAPIPRHDHNCFVTMAPDNMLNVWDIRHSTACIASFNQHVNRRESLFASLSPCMRYVACGSEDYAARIYDLRMSGRELVKLSGHHRDVVSAVAFNPLFAQVATASYDGTVKFFMDPNQLVY
jgi:WD40 repeat protein